MYEKGSDNIRLSFALEKDSEACRLAQHLPRILGPVKQMLGEQVYLWLSRINHKMACHGGLWLWHQDYTSWHMNEVADDVLSKLPGKCPSVEQIHAHRLGPQHDPN